MIDNCSFGSMTIGGRHYDSDLKIFPDGKVTPNWWRASGHLLTPDDIADLVASHPEVLVVGTGIYGRMQTDDKIVTLLVQNEIALVAEPTETAAQKFNAARNKNKRVAACFHLTC